LAVEHVVPILRIFELAPGIGASPGDGGGGACLSLLEPFGHCLRIDERGAG
jgi:hypothetical protein